LRGDNYFEHILRVSVPSIPGEVIECKRLRVVIACGTDKSWVCNGTGWNSSIDSGVVDIGVVIVAGVLTEAKFGIAVPLSDSVGDL
jgi:hypothetical protein